MNEREVDTKGNCSRCGGTHYGSTMCPMKDEAVVGGADFSFALRALKDGSRIRRAGWNGKGMWITLSPGGRVSNLNLWAPNNKAFAEGQRDGCAQVLPYITMKTADDCIVPWLASQTDLLAEDWEILRGAKKNGTDQSP